MPATGSTTAASSAGPASTCGRRAARSTVVTAAPPVVTNQGVLARRYAWKLEAPIKISYQGASSISLPQNNVAEVLVVRMPTHVVPRGYAIHQLVTRPAGGS